ncbi:hypothetical protein BH09PLA1_BH09PLA1_11380 [soil metagenome]
MSRKNSAHRRVNSSIYRNLVLAAAIAAPASLAGAQAVWVGPAGGGLWGEPSNWDTNFTPAFAGAIGRVDGNKPQNSDVLIDGGFTISNIIIDAGDQVRLANGQQIVFNESALTLQLDGLAIAANGSFTVQATSQNTDLNVPSGHNIFFEGIAGNGGGVVNLTNNGGAGSSRITGSGSLTNSITIQGAGSIGQNTLRLTNSGTIAATTGQLSIAPVNAGGAIGGLRNTGTLGASSGGELVLTGNGAGFFDSTGGFLSANNNSFVTLVTSADVRGGTIVSSGNGAVRVGSGNTASMRDVSVVGNLTASDNATLQLLGTINNSGSINVNAAANASVLSMAGTTVNLTGAGVVNLSQSGVGGASIGGTGTLNTSNTIQGFGNVGANNVAFLNTGTVVANSAAGGLTIDPVNQGGVNAGFTNNGTLLAAGNVLTLTGNGAGFFNNAGGRIIASSTDVQLVTSVDIRGGTLSSSGAGVIRAPGGNTAIASNVTNVGNVTVDPGATLVLGGAITNNGSFNVNSGTNASAVLSASGGSVSLSGPGFVNLTESGGGASLAGTGTFVNNQTVRGSGNVGANSTDFINNSLFLANTAATPLVIDPVNRGSSIPGFTNNGSLHANGGVLMLTGNGSGFFDNTNGRIVAGSTDVQLVTSVDIRGGTLTSSGAGIIRVPGGNTGLVSNLTNVGNLTADPGGIIQGGGVITNNGSININPSAVSSAQLNPAGGTVTLTGSGFVNLNEAGAGAFIQGTGTFINNQTVRGSGNVGNNNTEITNTGTFLANNATFALTLDPINFGGATGGFVNTGTLHANGGTLFLTGNGSGWFNNTGGRIVAGSTDVRLVSGVDIRGGTLSTGAGIVRVPGGNTAFLTGVTNDGNLTVDSGGILYPFNGGFTNNGSININAGTSSNAQLNPKVGSVAIGGSGVINLNDGGAVAFIQGTGTFVINQTVRGSGNIGNNNTAFTNNSVVRADVGTASLTVDPVSLGGANAGFINNGSLHANGGTLFLTGNGSGFFDNANGRIVAGSTDVRLVTGVDIRGGTLSTGAGIVRVPGGNTALLTGVTNDGNLTVDAGAILYPFNGGFTNNGSININADASSNAQLNPNGGSVAIGGSGVINLNDGGAIAYIQGTGRFVNNQTVRGGGNIGNNNTAITNNGTITANNATRDLTLDPVNLGGAAAGFTNNGTLSASGGQMIVTGNGAGYFDGGSSTISVASNGTVTMTTSADLRGASQIINNGVFNQTNSSVTTAKYIRGSGTLNVNTAARFNVAQDGTNAGTSRVAAMNIDAAKVDLTDNDLVIDYTGGSPITTVRGYLQTGSNGGLWNGNGLITSLATNIKRIGYAEASAIYSSFPASFSGQSVDNTSVLIKYTYAGDADLNGVVNFDDYSRTDNGFNSGGTVWSQGDYDYNGQVNFDDYALIDLAFNTQGGSLRRAMSYLEGNDRSGMGMDSPPLQIVQSHFAQFGEAYASSFLNAVPEPTSIGLFTGLAALAAGKRRRRRSH